MQDTPTAPEAAAIDTTAVEQPAAAPPGEDLLVDTDLVVEDISIDGMCGVY